MPTMAELLKTYDPLDKAINEVIGKIAPVATGTATLVGGTIAVADTNITANSVIRVANKTIGGTAGAPFISARSVGVSFTITSTSGTDTSVIQYDVVSY